MNLIELVAWYLKVSLVLNSLGWATIIAILSVWFAKHHDS